jgi:hypothetical protein
VAVPKAAVHEDCEPVAGKNDVRTAGQTGDMQAEAEAGGEQRAAHIQLGRSIRPANGGHHA